MADDGRGDGLQETEVGKVVRTRHQQDQDIDISTYENKLPKAPPSKTMSYRESIGLAKAALYAWRYPRMLDSSVLDGGAEASSGTSTLR